MSKLEKKIEFNKGVLIDYIDKIIGYYSEMEVEADPKKRKKLEKKAVADTRMVMLYVKKLNKYGADMNVIIEDFSEQQKSMINKILPNGTDDKVVDLQKERHVLISYHKKRLRELEEAKAENPPYDPSLPVKEKLKNKIYKCEKEVGYYLRVQSDKNKSVYEPAWNYKEHLDSSPEFTEEEKEIMRHCYKVAEEYNEYWEGKFDKMADKVIDVGYGFQAKKWARVLYKEICPVMVKEIYSDRNFTKDELENESKELTKRFLEFISKKDEVEVLIDQWNKLINDERLNTLDKYDKRAEIIKTMSKEIGLEEAWFVCGYASMSDPEEVSKIMSGYTYEELGLE